MEGGDPDNDSGVAQAGQETADFTKGDTEPAKDAVDPAKDTAAPRHRANKMPSKEELDARFRALKRKTQWLLDGGEPDNASGAAQAGQETADVARATTGLAKDTVEPVKDLAVSQDRAEAPAKKSRLTMLATDATEFVIPVALGERLKLRYRELRTEEPADRRDNE